ncbi:hypothetical protein FIBSPDRAFT_928190 [Athelia psychrophila]|uniref:CxC2-like cysteine cluster KDZ transposase-associated domain-containing protein n=1 Tax=Athelia psychrophila TaxID=1759441 RepID=A0A166QP16_9AGAM|nr:hypothetical protein FIBSPDRAFT_928190 [Fibularhizoctonia sp. CBS 109695]
MVHLPTRQQPIKPMMGMFTFRFQYLLALRQTHGDKSHHLHHLIYGRGETYQRGSPDKPATLGVQFLPVIQIWCHLKMLKRAGCTHNPLGIKSMFDGECTVECPACIRWIYCLILTIDANFRLKLKEKGYSADPALGNRCRIGYHTKILMHVAAYGAVVEPDQNYAEQHRPAGAGQVKFYMGRCNTTELSHGQSEDDKQLFMIWVFHRTAGQREDLWDRFSMVPAGQVETGAAWCLLARKQRGKQVQHGSSWPGGRWGIRAGQGQMRKPAQCGMGWPEGTIQIGSAPRGLARPRPGETLENHTGWPDNIIDE